MNLKGKTQALKCVIFLYLKKILDITFFFIKSNVFGYCNF